LPTLQHGIAKVNPLYKPLELTLEVLALSEGDFKKLVAAMEPEIIILVSERWRIMSFGELKLKLSTHDDGGAGTTRNCEKVLQFKGSKGEVYSAKSSDSLSGLGGSLVTFEAIPAFFSGAALLRSDRHHQDLLNALSWSTVRVDGTRVLDKK